MIRITALNDDTSRSSEEDIIHPKEPSQEVQEENALKSYNEALQDQKNGNIDKAESTYKYLIDSSLLRKVKPDQEGGKAKKLDNICSLYAKPSLMLKYSCLKNMAVISCLKNNLECALDYYTQALDIEGTDVTVWHKAGVIALKLSYINVACDFFYKGLECSPKHWLCLDKIIMCLFALGDFINCLYYTARAFSLDNNYTRGHIVREQILLEQPSLESDIQLYYPKINLFINKVIDVNKEIKDKLKEEILSLREEYHEKLQTRTKAEQMKEKQFLPATTIESSTWSSLGEFILQIHSEMTDEKKNVSFLSSISLKAAEDRLVNLGAADPDADNKSKESNVLNSTKDKPGDDAPGKEQNEDGEKKNKKGRGSALMEELLWGGKRRSARVRSSLRGNPEPMDVAEALRRILPRKLLHKTKQPKSDQTVENKAMEDSMDTMDLYRLFERQESAEERRQKEEQERSEVEHDIVQIVEREGYFGTAKETGDVIAFIGSNDRKSIIDIIKSYILALETHWKKTWPNLLPGIYIRCYKIMRKYLQISFKMCRTESGFKELVLEAGSVLLYGELSLEHCVSSRNTPQTLQKSETSLDISFMQNIMELTDRCYLFESDEKYFEYLVRLYWLRCHIFLKKGQTNLAIATLNELLSCYDLHPERASSVIKLRNNRKNNVISKPIAEEFLVFQSRKRSLAEVVRLYEDGSYQELTEILKETFTSAQDNVGDQFKEQENELVNRQTQLSMLINGLYHLNEYKECIYWLETCCYELLQKAPISAYYSSDEPGEESWMVVLDRFLVAMEDCLALGNCTLDEALPHSRVSRFVQTLCHAICKELEDSDRPPCPARPWIMLNKILTGIEGKERKEAAAEGADEDEDNDIPSSVLILFTAHEYLGRREWCSCNDSVLLYLIMDQVIPNIRSRDWSSFRETIQQHLEQVVYCLYSHPNKKTKARYLTEHNVSSKPLTWKRGIQLFDLFRPDETPAYDSLRINLIGSETEVLFRRIAALIPDENDPAQNSEKMMDFIIGKRNDVPEATVKLPDTVQDLFYILGDYYFKTHESAKAVNYLLIDLCANPDRVDSWASMALSRASILEQQLNSCDPVKDEVFLQDALSALRCYEHCLQLDSSQCALWIEYGTFVYTIHSFCSQRMKLESLSLGMEKFEELETTKNKMLDTAKQAFINANLIWYEVKEESERQDERWLHHYMLGKICEKHGDLNYLEHYEKAAELLYENEAEYPTKIGYTTPQTLSIEALEVYYRIHVCVIKNLELNEGKPLDSKTRQMFNKYLELVEKGHFVTQMSKSELAKTKAKEAEAAAQNAKHMKIIRDALDDIIRKVELIEAEEVEREKEVARDAADERDEPDKSDIVEERGAVRERRRQSYDRVESDGKRLNVDFGQLVRSKSLPDNSLRSIDDRRWGSDRGSKDDSVSGHRGNPPSSLEKGDGALGGNKNVGESHESYGRYVVGLDDVKSESQAVHVPPKKKRRPSRMSGSSSSGESRDVKYDDESSSSSSSSDSSDSSPTSSSSSKESTPSDEANRERNKALEDDGKVKASESTPEEASTPESGDVDEKSSPLLDRTENDMLTRCLLALETCAIRFPQHYKSVYRLAHFYFRSKKHRDLSKCKDLLLGRYHTPNGMITGLFAERKNTNFFNGIWRIPAGDVDRPGSFASHMSRSVLLLMEVLRDLKDHKMLLELCLQLRKVPEPDKKYLREDERNQLSIQAVNLSVKTLQRNVRECTVMTLPMVLDSYRCYQKVQKHCSQRDGAFGDILLDSFKRLGKGDKCTLDQAMRFCQSEISAQKNKIPRSVNQNPGVHAKPKPPKAKKEDKKKATPKPQMTAKAVPKPPKPKKQAEARKTPSVNMMYGNLMADSAYLSTVMKNWPSGSGPDSAKKGSGPGSVSYSDLLKNACQTVKKSDKKAAGSEQKSVANIFEQMNLDYNQQLIMEQMKLMTNPSLYHYQNYPVDFGGDFFKQYNSLYNNALIGNYLSQFQSYRKPKVKNSKPRTILKPRPAVKAEAPPKADDKKAKTNFNIDDILAKPSTSSGKPQSPNVLTPSQINMSIEDKIKNAFNDMDASKEQLEAINLSPCRKKVHEAIKHPLADVAAESASAKRMRYGSGFSSADREDDIEVVVIDD